ncbi:hypothetical protein GCM10011316_11970 [Roseibium aquae]|uniref:Autotransporter domain-containing protein n=1 Tax=Roseibium aquae TaxID=1323746 RepID=A0A916TF53_9HYPH|nr:autotransporter outer membrane beta-barrel domain-containing protein [Roseibium aquae]GGB41624.1 hypothetical protein GCM10011316_11970 [Roseibium aquae]
MPLFSRSSPSSAMPLIALLLSSTALAPANASCSTSADGLTLTCSGDVQPISVNGGTFNVVVQNLTSDMVRSGDQPVLIQVESRVVTVGPYDDGFRAVERDDDGKTETWGKGGNGDAGSSQVTTLSLGDGFGLTSGAGGIAQKSFGARGHNGKDNSGAGAHTHRGGYGGDGGRGGNITLNASGTVKNGKGAGISAGTLAVLDLQSFGGGGGFGGEGHSEGGFNDGYGGFGGVGGAGGYVSVTLSGDTHLTANTNDASSAVAGVYLVSAGGVGGVGGEGDGRGATGGYGGDGGSGGSGGKVSLSATSTSNNISTAGVHGLALISRAGAGGDGGRGVGGGAHPGSGGTGGNGGTVTAEFAGKVTTTGEEIHAIVLQSAGGANGDEGTEGRGVSHPGHPGDPGMGGEVNGTFTALSATTNEDGAIGILAHSVGGFAPDAPASSGFSSFGATGGSGGAAGDVGLLVRGGSQVTTKGDYAIAVTAHSVGGGGGAGGSSSGVTALGGVGGAGGYGGDVNVTLEKSGLETQGLASIGLAALSVGGSGGVGGSAKGIVSHGGSAGSGGLGGTVSVSFDGATISTQKDSALGVIAASIGGGGGVSQSPSGIIAHGGSGGDGGDGGNVNYTSGTGGLSVSTKGANADGVSLVSVGGGGGQGGSTFALTLFATHAMGGSGGNGGRGGDITLSGSAEDTITTTGNTAAGYAVVSVGGGGGRSGSSTTINLIGAGPSNSSNSGINFGLGSSGGGGTGNHGGAISGNLAGKVTTSGHASPGVLLVSTGQGGGAAGNYSKTTIGVSFSHTLGASGGAGGNGGDINVSLANDITTAGHDAGAIVAVSVGGGGGHSSNIVNTTVGVDLAFTTRQGASGGNAGNGGNVTLNSNGALTTGGHLAGGILAVSAAKGGGKSGNSVIAGVDVVTLSDMTAGTGGAGGTAGAVTVTHGGTITTGGGLAYGIVAASVGSGGGASGTSVNGNVSALNLGGDTGGQGGTGGIGGIINVTTNSGSGITTTGDMATGLLALSVGGKGGAGGSVYYGAVSVVGGVANIGGGGADGGTGSEVIVTNSGTITTSGNKAAAILAQSRGGSGGVGGMVAGGTAGISPDPEVPSINLNVSIGGSGGAGGTADTVTITNNGVIKTSGYQASGAVGMSHGGSGGSGGTVWAGSVNAGAGKSGSFTLTVGGSGGSGGKGGAVVLTNNAGITTTGHFSSAIYAQSVGGDGGQGGSSHGIILKGGNPGGLSASVTVGGGGGDGAVGGEVTVTNSSVLATTGGNAHGVFAQSIGGNGGDGGAGIGFLGNYTPKVESDFIQVNLDTQVGGGAGKGMDAGAVNVTNSGNISTTQDTSYGVFAQSVGGGGGQGGNAGAYTFGYSNLPEEGERPENKGYSLNVALGGSGGGAGDGKDVTVTNDTGTTVSTQGIASYALFAQSIGGGGGTGGNGEPGLEGWLADVYDWAEKFKSAKEAWEQLNEVMKGEFKDIFRESFAVSVGGTGGASGKGGTVLVTNDGFLTTSGNDATAIFAQSVGGGGGVGGDGAQGLMNEFGIGGSGGGSGDGGAVTVKSGTITTTGDRALGVFAQSIGGGGGVSGEAEMSIIDRIGDTAEDMIVGAFSDDRDASDGDGGAVKVTVQSGASITTSGETAHGIFAQSGGGGGGAASKYKYDKDAANFVVDEAKAGSGGGAGDGGRIEINIDGRVSVSGKNANAIFAQSVAGADDSLSDGVKVTVNGTVEAKGENGRAIHLQVGESKDSDSSSGGVSHVIVNKGGIVQKLTHEDGFEAIAFVGGRSTYNSDGTVAHSNLLTNDGYIFSPTNAITTDGKSALRVENTGTIYGQFNLKGDAQTRITNAQGGLINIGGSNLGTSSKSTFINSGTLKPGWANDTRTITITSGGSFVQTSTGKLKFDVDLSSSAPKNGQLVLNTGSATLSGSFLQNFIHNPDLATGDKGTFTDIVTYSGSGSFSRDGLSAPSGTALAYTLNWGSQNNLSVDYEVDYSGVKSGANLGRNAQRFGIFFDGAMQAVREARLEVNRHNALSNLGRRILNAGSNDELKSIYREHMADEAAVGAQKALSAGQAIQSLLRSCPELDPNDPKGFYRQRECVWGKAIGGIVDQETTDSMPGFEERVAGFAVGAQRAIGEGLFVETVGQYEEVWVEGSNFKQEGHQISAGVALKKEIGNLELSGSVSGGMYMYDHQRTYSAGTGWHNASGDIDGQFVSGELRAAAIFEENGTYAKPSASIAVTRIWQDDFSETGDGALNWDVGAVTHTAVYVRPMLEIGRAFDLSGSAAVGFVRAGLVHQLTDPDMAFTTELTGGRGDLDGLNLTLASERTKLEFEAGLNADLSDRLSLELLGQSAFSDSSQALAGQVRFRLQF